MLFSPRVGKQELGNEIGLIQEHSHGVKNLRFDFYKTSSGYSFDLRL